MFLTKLDYTCYNQFEAGESFPSSIEITSLIHGHTTEAWLLFEVDLGVRSFEKVSLSGDGNDKKCYSAENSSDFYWTPHPRMSKSFEIVNIILKKSFQNSSMSDALA